MTLVVCPFKVNSHHVPRFISNVPDWVSYITIVCLGAWEFALGHVTIVFIGRGGSGGAQNSGL